MREFPLLTAFLLSLFLISNLHAQTVIQKRDGIIAKQNKALSLAGAIEQALRANYTQNQRDYNQEILDINWENTKDSFWLPQLSLSLQTADQRIARLKSGDGDGLPRRPTGSLSLGFNDYNIFNWGKDYLEYLNSRETFLRSTTSFKEQRRALRHEVIVKYFEVAYLQKISNIYRRQLRHASFVYRFNKEKVSIRKVSKQEYYQARSEYLGAQNSFQEISNQQRVAEEELAFIISDKPGTRYFLKDQLSYKKVQMPLEDAEKIALKNNPEILESRKDVNNARRSYQIQLRENLPLPTFKVNLGAYRHSFGQGINSTGYNSGINGNNIDIRASIDATWSITGSGGFLNQRTTDALAIARRRSFSELAQARHQTLSDIQRAYYRLRTYEQQIRILEASSQTNNRTFDVILENYLDRKTAFINFSDALTTAVSSDAALAQAYYLHTQQKVLLAQEMGLDEFPGKSFEQLGVPKEGGK